MNNKYLYIAFFDLDRTLAGMNSGHAMIRTAYDEGLMGKRDMLRAIIQTALYKIKITGTEDMISAMGRWIRGNETSLIRNLAEESVKRYLILSVFREAMDEIDRHRKKQAAIVLLSSAIEEICTPFAGASGIDAVIASKMQCINGIYTGEPSGKYCYGEEKREQISRYCSENGFDQKEAYYYADSISDLPALETVGNPVCVNPDRKLAAIAGKRGWKTLYWNNRIAK